MFIIGIYNPNYNPLEKLPKKKFYAIAAEAFMQGAVAIFFDSEDVDIENRSISGLVRDNGKWVRKVFSFPDVIININPPIKSKRGDVEIFLRENIPFTTNLIDNKYVLASKLLNEKDFSKIIIPSKKLVSTHDFFEFIGINNEVILKPVSGRRGQGIKYINKVGDSYLLIENQTKKSMDKESILALLNDLIENSNDHLIQKFITTKTNKGYPFDFRCHLQKDRNGHWVISKIYPRIGNKKGIITNVSQGGLATDFDYFMLNEFEDHQQVIGNNIKYYSLLVARFIDKLYKTSIDELGIDLALDNNGKIWFYEANAGPGNILYEWETAEHTVGYALFLAEKVHVKNHDLISNKVIE